MAVLRVALGMLRATESDSEQAEGRAYRRLEHAHVQRRTPARLPPDDRAIRRRTNSIGRYIKSDAKERFRYIELAFITTPSIV